MKTIIRKWNGFLKEGEAPKVATFDFDDTLLELGYDRGEGFYAVGPRKVVIDRLKEHRANGVTVYIVTSRYDEAQLSSSDWPHDKSDPWYIPMVQEFLDEHGLVVDGIHFTNGRLKVRTLIMLGSSVHYDDDSYEIMAIRKVAPHIQVVDSWEMEE